MRDRLRYWLDQPAAEPRRSLVFKMIGLLDNQFERHPKAIIGACAVLILIVGFGDVAYEYLSQQSEKDNVGIVTIIAPTPSP